MGTRHRWLVLCIYVVCHEVFWCRGHLSGNHYTIEASHSGKFLNAAGNTTHNGAQSLIELFSRHYCHNPVLRAAKESTTIPSLYLGTNVHQWDNPGTTSTQWIIRAV